MFRRVASVAVNAFQGIVINCKIGRTKKLVTSSEYNMASVASHSDKDNGDSLKIKTETESSNCKKEGKAEVFLPSSVFYNPVQEFNRDLTIAVISQHARDHFARPAGKKPRKPQPIDKSSTTDQSSETTDNEPLKKEPIVLEARKKYENGLSIFEGLAASGLRSVRFALEIPGVKQITTNDFDQTAVEFIKTNVAHNNVEELVTPSYSDAAMKMYQSRSHSARFSVIDLDPYGSPSAFLDSAVQAVEDGGLLCITCTDMAILCGNAPETCYSKYGSVPLKARYCHEMALRIVLQCIDSHANRYSRYIVPLLSVSVDFYVRVFVRVYTGQSIVKQSVAKRAYVYSCTGCGAFTLQRLANKIPTKGENFKFTPSVAPPVEERCQHCNFKHHIGGPIWADRIHDGQFVQKVIVDVEQNKSNFMTAERIIGMLSMVTEELPDQPLYYITDDLVKIVHCTPPSLLQFRSAILNAGYEVSLSHAQMNSIKTSAPMGVIWDILKCWIKEHPVKMEKLKDGSPAKFLLSQPSKLDVSFDIREDANPKSREKGLLRWQMNPERDWGPKARAHCGEVETLEERRLKGVEKAKERKAQRNETHKRKAEEDVENDHASKMKT